MIQGFVDNHSTTSINHHSQVTPSGISDFAQATLRYVASRFLYQRKAHCSEVVDKCTVMLKLWRMNVTCNRWMGNHSSY
jgi:hypothetical protein